MRLRSREQPEVFGTSLLDMMTCSLGAVILLFVLKSAVETGMTETWKKRLEHQQALHQQATNQQARADITISNATKRIQKAAEGSVFGLPKFTGKMMPWVRVGGRYEELGRKLNDAIEQSQGISKTHDNLGPTPLTQEVIERSLQHLIAQPRGGNVMRCVPIEGTTEPDLAELEALATRFETSLGLEQRTRVIRFQTVGFVEAPMLVNENARRFCIVSQFLSTRYGGVFIAIPTP